MNEITPAVAFNYAALDSESRIIVQQKTGEIRERMGRAVQDLFEIGSRLNEVKQRLVHGQFEAWLQQEFSWGLTTAWKYMRVHSMLESSHCEGLQIAPSALYLLASPSTPEEVKAEFIDRAKAGETITHAEVKAKVDPRCTQCNAKCKEGERYCAACRGEGLANPAKSTVTETQTARKSVCVEPNMPLTGPERDPSRGQVSKPKPKEEREKSLSEQSPRLYEALIGLANQIKAEKNEKWRNVNRQTLRHHLESLIELISI